MRLLGRRHLDRAMAEYVSYFNRERRIKVSSSAFPPTTERIAALRTDALSNCPCSEVFTTRIGAQRRYRRSDTTRARVG
jgi:hypothetical protein